MPGRPRIGRKSEGNVARREKARLAQQQQQHEREDEEEEGKRNGMVGSTMGKVGESPPKSTTKTARPGAAILEEDLIEESISSPLQMRKGGGEGGNPSLLGYASPTQEGELGDRQASASSGMTNEKSMGRPQSVEKSLPPMPPGE
uniref:Uncharacterized protein n=1 Tax=Palpitomonas bilix TaxID=652834 RepID=A0A7S3LSP0_9EUKA